MDFSSGETVWVSDGPQSGRATLHEIFEDQALVTMMADPSESRKTVPVERLRSTKAHPFYMH
ncbi:MAG: hypothetical protein H6867_00495 [Rhodospirillales bacterium]|nr:hypothetical protein [Rhodospirillales bacterium]MCB9996863.1 hypothetical protein [Rhodospirillales bacterium]